MKLKTVTKRSGNTVNYDRNKIFNAIAGANQDATTPSDKLAEADIDMVTEAVEMAISDHDSIGVEEIQDVVEKRLMEHGFFDVAKQYILYRDKHTRRREAQKRLMETYRDIFFANSADVDLKRDNANINTDASMGIMLKLGAEGSKHFVDNYVLPENFASADHENYIHIHDKDFSLITFNCCQIDLLKLFHGGFSTGHGFLREPNSIRSYASLACIAIQSNQNDMFGGQSINAFDYAMAEGIRKSFKKAVFAEIEKAAIYSGLEIKSNSDYKTRIDFDICRYAEGDNPAAVKHLANILGLNNKMAEIIYKQACKNVEEETHQAMEALIHNFNTLHSRAGAQVPFSSINYGMDTSPEGRLAIREVLNATNAGLGNGETPIFPISVFQLKRGVNYDFDDPNYDLFRYACKVSAKRLFPNFVNLDAPYNIQYYKPGDYNSYIATMGCADGDEIVSYRYKGKFYCEGLNSLWNRMDGYVYKRGISNYIKPEDLQVWDGSAGRFARVKTVIKNPDQGNWMRLHFQYGRSVLVTADHPFYTENRGRIRASELEIGDSIASYYNFPNIEFNNDSISDIDRAYELGIASNSIDSEIFTAPREIRLAFLAALMDRSGYIDYKSTAMLGNHNKQYSLQQLALIQSLGDFKDSDSPAKLYVKQRTKGNLKNIRYRIEFKMTDEIAKYMRSGKQNDYLKSERRLEPRIPNIVKLRKIEHLGAIDKESFDLETATDKFTLSFLNSGNCRTRVMSNVNGPEESGSRGNFAFVTINLPKLALEAKGNIDEFFTLFDKYIRLSHDYILFRLKTIEEKHVYNYPFLMGQGVWMGSEKLKPTDSIRDVLKHASLSIGFCGLAECLVALTGKHHGESEEAQQLGLKIIGFLRNKTDKYTADEHKNWTTFATPAESTAGQFQKSNRKVYGLIKGVTDRAYMTNSNHVPVYYKMKAIDKIAIEAPYHALCNAGHIAYIEIDGDPAKNPTAFEAVVRAMHDADMGYFSINHPVDRDPICGYTGIIENECPHCHRREIMRGSFHIKRLK